jgi:hypothetical protein
MIFFLPLIFAKDEYNIIAYLHAYYIMASHFITLWIFLFFEEILFYKMSGI